MKRLRVPKVIYGVWGKSYAGEWSFYGAALSREAADKMREQCLDDPNGEHEAVTSVPFGKIPMGPLKRSSGHE